MNDTITRPVHHKTIDRAQLATGVGAVALFIALTLVVAPHLSTVSGAKLLVVSNTTPWSATVEVRLDDGWVPVGVATSGTTSTMHHLPDAGPTWTMRFSAGPVQVVEKIPRSRLLEDDWAIVVPGSFADAARSAELPPTPPGL